MQQYNMYGNRKVMVTMCSPLICKSGLDHEINHYSRIFMCQKYHYDATKATGDIADVRTATSRPLPHSARYFAAAPPDDREKLRMPLSPHKSRG